MAAMLPRKASSGVFWARRGVVQARVARTKRFMKLAPVDSNHHSQIQSLVSCRWTRGQRDGKNLHYDPVSRRGAACCAPTRRLGSDALAEPKLPKRRRCGPTTVARTESAFYAGGEHHPR